MPESRIISVILPLAIGWEPVYSTVDGAIRHGDRVRVIFSGREYVGVVDDDGTKSSCGTRPVSQQRGAHPLDPSKIKAIIGRDESLYSVSAEEIRFWKELAQYYMCTVGEVYKAASPFARIEEDLAAARAESRLEDRLRKLREDLARAESSTRVKETTREKLREKIAELTLRKERDSGLAIPPGTGCKEIQLTQYQLDARDGALEGFKAGKTVLLDGVTGSGKTEIYLELAAKTVGEGRNVLYLVPEIALSRALAERVAERFPGVMVFNSEEAGASRRRIAEKVRSVSGYIVLGTRSSIFLPHRNLGLIIVDEEHDTSYKQTSPAPRYNGRDAALILSTIHKSNVILGSATPSLESLYNSETGLYKRVRLDRKFFSAERPEIRIIDTKAEWKKRGMAGSFSRKLITAIRQTLSEGRQAMILRSRRAYAPLLQCSECGEVLRCPSCNVPLSLHGSAATGYYLLCHHCGRKLGEIPFCSKCGGTYRMLGAGTQKIEEEAKALFPEAMIARLDSDIGSAEGKDIVNAFATGDYDILIGTQIVTKGFDFGNLGLVAVIGADQILSQQDFRADERAFQLLSQFGGRAGRREHKGLVIIQTAQPEHPVLQAFVSGEPVSAGLLAERKAFNMPPYTRIISITMRHEDEATLERWASILSGRLRSTEGWRVEGPYSPLVDISAGKHLCCFRIILSRDGRLKGLKKSLGLIIERFSAEFKCRGDVIIDVDPV